MEKNINTIQKAVDYIDSHLEEKLDLDSISKEVNYSKYHLSRMFVNIVGFSVHQYIQRRRLTESARLLVFTEMPILEIALLAGYETQRSFTAGFKALYRYSPRAFRRKRDFCPLQLKFTVDGKRTLRGDKIMNIRTIDSGNIMLAGYRKNTRLGFFVIGKCWRKMHAEKHRIQNRTDMDFLIGLNDYSIWETQTKKQPAFDYFAAAEVDSAENVPKGMEIKELPPCKYIIFSFRGKREDSLQPVADYIYKEWFPQSTCRLNGNAPYDFAKYGEHVDADGNSRIEYWVPVL